MLTPEYYEHVSDRIIELYAELDSAIVADIARRIVRTGEITETAEWQLRQLQESGMVYDDILREIGRHTGQSERELRRIFKDAGIESIRNDNEVYSAAGKGKINLTAAGMQVLNAGFKRCHGSLNNLTLTTANTSQSAFINACNAAYMQVVSGAFDYNTAIRKAVRTVAQNGSEVLYPSGHRDKVDVAVRRAVLTGVGQTCRTLSETNAEEMGCDLMEISAHAGARPSHAEWQGQIVSLSGRKGYLSKSDIGYGTGEGFGGWNCRHDWYPFFEGISKRNYTKESIEQLNTRNIEHDGKMYTQYEISQMQRQFEREIRALKREAAALSAAAEAAAEESLKDELKADFTGVAVNLKSKETMLKQFLKETHQDRENAREQVGGFGRSEAQKAVWANKKALIDLTDKDYSDIIHLRGKLSNADVRKWYLAHDKNIPNLIDKTKSIEEQARYACELRNMYRFQARELMADQNERQRLDIKDPNRSFEELVEIKMNKKGMTRNQAIADILATATKTRNSVDKKFGLE